VTIRKKALLTPIALAIGWSVLAATNGVAWIARTPASSASYVIRWEAVDNALGFAVSVLLFLVYARLQKRLGGVWLVLAAVPLCFASGMLWRYVTAVVMWYCKLNWEFAPDAAMILIRGGLMDGTTLGLVSFLYFGIDYWRQASEQREKARQATALAQQAQLQMLRYQLNPHFLFNALNSIRAMIVENPARSREMVTELADFLRYSLDGKDQESTIGDEIQAIENYLSIQRIRFETQLDATVQADDAALKVPVPCFLIHPLVENAVKYGMQTSAMPLRVRIEVASEGEETVIRVSNTGRLSAEGPEQAARELPEGTGTGLKNIAERLKLVFPDRHSFRMWESGGWVRAEIRLRPAARGLEA